MFTHNKGVIIDEIQRAPNLFSYIQTIVDSKNKTGMFLLTGSQNILLQENISQTLAGRVAILKLLPLTLKELQQTSYYSKGSLFEAFIISEIIKSRLNKYQQPGCYYWRDKTGNEVDCILELSNSLLQIEIKSGKTIADDYFDGLIYWNKLAGKKNSNPY